LRLGQNGVTPSGAEALLSSPRLPALVQVELGGNPISAKAQRRLRRRFGGRVTFWGV
jgi:hypothetical protein